MQFYEVFIKPILTNQIVVDWIAPIITSLICIAVPTILTKFFKSKSLIKSINMVNNKIIDTIRPFIIQRIEISSDFISSIRIAIIKESNIKEKNIYTELEIRNKLLLDISETRFLKEEEKRDLIEFTYKVFEDFSKTPSKYVHAYDEYEEQRIRKYKTILYLLVFIFSIIIMLIAYILNPVGENIEDNVVIIMTLITSISSFSLLFSDQIFHDYYISNYARHFNKKYTKILKRIINMKIDNKQDKIIRK